MYASLRCVGWSPCRTSARTASRVALIPHRTFRTSPARKQAAPTSDPAGKREEDAGDKARAKDKSTTSKWRRRQVLNARGSANDSYMIVDPSTGSAEIVERNTRGRDKKQTRRLPPFKLPAWFDDCVTWPNTAEKGIDTQKDSLPDPPADEAISSVPSSNDQIQSKKEEKSSPKDSQQIMLLPSLFKEISGVIRAGLELSPANEKDTPLSLRSTVSIHCPLDGSMSFLDDVVEQIAIIQKAGVLRLNAQDLAELGGAYVCPDAYLDASLQTLPFDAYAETVEETPEDEDAMDEEEQAEEDDRPKPPGMQSAGMFLTPTLIPMQGNIGDILKKLTGAHVAGIPGNGDTQKSNKLGDKTDEDADAEVLMDEERLDKFLNTVIDGAWSRYPGTTDSNKAGSQSGALSPKLIIRIEDLIRISQTGIGIELVEKLADVVRRRRTERGEKIVLVGLSIDSDCLTSTEAEKTIQWETDHSIWRTFIAVPQSADGKVITSQEPSLRNAHAQRNTEMNVRNWYMVATQMAPSLVSERSSALKQLEDTPDHFLGLTKSIFQRDEMQRIATASIASALEREEGKLNRSDLIRATSVCQSIDIQRQWKLESLRNKEADRGSKYAFGGVNLKSARISDFDPHNIFGPDSKTQPNGGSQDVAARLQALQRDADRYEKRLINGVVLPERIKTTFGDVHVAESTVEAVRDLTALSLQRPDAFKYGVLATNTLSGLLLYGPPGTGKTMLAKAVAKESEAAVLTVTGSDVNQMWVGESEKTVKAIFTLARKLAPCVVFIDEADALLASRGSSGRGGRPNHKDTINQFLLEWDGMNESGVFLMVATNRPFDLDDAVLRRLPRRVLIDLPTKADREAILRIHLKDETISPEVDIPSLAEQTPYYSGSDLKNVIVSAALTAVKEELTAKNKAEAAGTEYNYPEKRILTKAHFDKAMGEIGASVSGDMSSLRQIKKFDEQYGDRKGRRKKNPYGFMRAEEREEDARVRA